MRTEITRDFRNARDFSGHGLRYFATTDDKHVVCFYMPAGEQDFPNVYRHETIEAARETWRRIQSKLIADGSVIV